VKKKQAKKSKLESIFDKFEDHVALSEWHQPAWVQPTKRFQEAYQKKYDAPYLPRYYHPVYIHWSEKGRGFGSYCFWRDDKGRIFCDNEGDSRETVKRILCRLVDKAIFPLEMTPAMRSAEQRRYTASMKTYKEKMVREVTTAKRKEKK
jgi:hypothetical protein